jgi:hypothetical protein
VVGTATKLAFTGWQVHATGVHFLDTILNLMLKIFLSPLLFVIALGAARPCLGATWNVTYDPTIESDQVGSIAIRAADGDTVIVRQQVVAEDGDIVVALVDEEGATVKKLKKCGERVQLVANAGRHQLVPRVIESHLIYPLAVTVEAIKHRRPLVR